MESYSNLSLKKFGLIKKLQANLNDIPESIYITIDN